MPMGPLTLCDLVGDVLLWFANISGRNSRIPVPAFLALNRRCGGASGSKDREGLLFINKRKKGRNIMELKTLLFQKAGVGIIFEP